MIEYFQILNLDYDISEKELKNAFRELSKKYHPDTNSGSDKYVDKFRKVKDAYEKLLIFIKSNRYQKWKKSQEKINNEKGASSSRNSEFKYYEFKNDDGIFDHDSFEKKNEFSIKKQYSTAEQILVGDLSYTIHDFNFTKEFGKDFFKAKSDGFFLIVELEIQNISKRMISLHNYMFRIFDFEGYFYEFSNEGL